MPDITKIEISTGTFLRLILVILGFAFLYLIRDVVAIILLSVVIASAIEPAAQWFIRYRIPRVLSVLLVYIISFSILVASFSIIIPPLFDEIVAVSPESFIKSASGAFFELVPQIPVSISGAVIELINNSSIYLEKLAGGFFQATSVVFGGALSFILVVVISFYLAVQERGIENFLRIVTPIEYERYILDLWSRARRKIGAWMQSQILLGVLIGVMVYLGLTILQIKFALSLAVIAAIFELIPVFGPVLAAIPAVLIAFLQSPAMALVVIVFYFIVQQFENHLIVPIVFKKSVGVPPILVVIALIVGGELGGFFGLLLAVPLAAVLVEFLNDVAARKQIT